MLTNDDIKREYGFTDDELEEGRVHLAEYLQSYDLQKARKDAGMTQTQVAEKMGVPQSRVSDIENGNVESMSIGSLRRYAAAIGRTLRITLV